MRKILFLGLFFLNFNFLWAQNSDEEAHQVPFEEKIEVTPDLLELVVEMDPTRQGFLAKNHSFQVSLSADFLINGRLTAGFQYHFHRFLALDIPVSFDHSLLGQWGGRKLGIYGDNSRSQWSLLAGLGLKIRLTEWMMKSSFYLEPMIQAGYSIKSLRNTGNDSLVLSSSIPIRFSMYLGFESVFDTGVVVGGKLGVEYPLELLLLNRITTPTSLSVVPMISLGYAW
ncbi:hypothetical protein FJ364_03540 [Candidatus Dependentiae bacterium]|nr:hypothetical protein [Candidatus Dependentiae bacterium]